MQHFCWKMKVFFGILQIATFCCLLQYRNVQAKSDFDMFFTNITCTQFDPDGYLRLLTCSVSRNVKRRTFTIEIQFTREIKQFFVNMRVALPNKNGGGAFQLFNLTNIDGCKLLNQKNSITFIRMGSQILERFANLPKRCPFVKDQLYYIRNFRPDLSAFPALTFETYMNIWFDLIVQKKKVFSGLLESHVHMKRGSSKVDNGFD